MAVDSENIEWILCTIQINNVMQVSKHVSIWDSLQVASRYLFTSFEAVHLFFHDL